MFFDVKKLIFNDFCN